MITICGGSVNPASCASRKQGWRNALWIQLDGTEDGIAGDLLAAGIPKDRIVLGFKSPDSRQHTGFAVA